MKKNSPFQKVGECLYRYSSNGVYYARIKIDGKEIRQSLGTTDHIHARRNLAKLEEISARLIVRRAGLRFANCATDGLKRFKMPSQKR